MKIGFVTGLAAEAALLRGRMVASGDGTPAGARTAAEFLVGQGAQALVSFGLAGGLRPGLVAGTVLVPSGLLHFNLAGAEERLYHCDLSLMAWLGGSTGATILAGDTIAATASDKSVLFRLTNAQAIDLESGAVAQVAAAHGLPFAILRAIADPAERDLAPAALIPLRPDGGINLPAILWSVVRHPAQIPKLIALARDAGRARTALVGRLRNVKSA